jgi:dienelactone hydrolase
MKSAKAIVAVTLAAAAFLGCDGNPVGQNSPAQLTLSTDVVDVSVNASSPLTATVRDATGATQYVSLRYVSRDPDVAAVNANGVISGVAVGSTYVVATIVGHPGARDSARVRVHPDSCAGARPDFGGPATAEDRQLFSYDINAPLNLQQSVTETTNGVEGSTIAFSSPDGGMVTGRMWVPIARSGLRPGIVLMHGLPGTANSVAGRAQSYAEHGAVVIAISAPWNRRAAPPYLTYTEQDRAEQIQIVKDLQRAVDVLRSHPNVDHDRIAFEGGSWGGATGALFAGIERRLKAVALVVGHSGQVSHHTGPFGFKHIAGLPCARRNAWIRAMAPIEPIRFVGQANAPLFMQNGSLDHLVPNAHAEELHAAASQPKEVRWYDAGHSLNQQAVVDRLRWLHEKIGVDAPKGS